MKLRAAKILRRIILTKPIIEEKGIRIDKYAHYKNHTTTKNEIPLTQNVKYLYIYSNLSREKQLFLEFL